jgi:CHASE3 domain sensor protein
MNAFSNWTVGKRLVAGFGLSALTLVVISIVSYHNASRLIENDTWVKHTHQVRTDLGLLLSQLKDAETGQRGYLITGQDSYLAPHQAAIGGIQATLDNLRRLTTDNPNQQRRLSAMAPLIDAKLAELKQTIELRRTQGLDAATKVVLTDAGKNFMDQTRAIVAREHHFLAERMGGVARCPLQRGKEASCRDQPQPLRRLPQLAQLAVHLIDARVATSGSTPTCSRPCRARLSRSFAMPWRTESRLKPSASRPASRQPATSPSMSSAAGDASCSNVATTDGAWISMRFAG